MPRAKAEGKGTSRNSASHINISSATGCSPANHVKGTRYNVPMTLRHLRADLLGNSRQK
jgi:hypothetical protein